MKKPTLIALLILSILAPAERLKGADVSDLEYFNNGSFVTITGCASSAVGELIIPTLIEGVPVKVIGEFALNGNKLTKINLPSTLVSIEINGLSSSSELIEIFIPEGVKNIERSAFAYCDKLTEINLPNSVMQLDSSIFSGCTNLRSVKLPINIDVLPDSFFRGCTSLKTIDGIERIREIEHSAFWDCVSINFIRLTNINTIGAWAFDDCEALETVIIGDGINRIGSWAFRDCMSLKNIYFSGNSNGIDITDTVFEGVLDVTIYITPNAEGFENTYAGFPVVVGAQQLVDSDNDGVVDNEDAFPNDPNETVDSDGDGVGDNGDAFPNYKGETADSDGNGIGDNAQSSIAKTKEINDLNAQLTQRAEEINSLKAQLDQSLTLDQIQDLRIGSAILTTDVERNRATLKIRIEESSDLKTWTTKNTITKFYTLKDGKKFYRFALDK